MTRIHKIIITLTSVTIVATIAVLLILKTSSDSNVPNNNNSPVIPTATTLSGNGGSFGNIPLNSSFDPGEPVIIGRPVELDENQKSEYGYDPSATVFRTITETNGIRTITFEIQGDDDRDGDRLLSSKEIILGTDPQKADTDSDGANDGNEVNKLKTNPNKADTDSDGINDGDEVTQKRDPLDPAK